MTVTMSQVEISVGAIIGESFFKIFLALIAFAGTMPQGWKLSLLMNGLMIPTNLIRFQNIKSRMTFVLDVPFVHRDGVTKLVGLRSLCSYRVYRVQQSPPIATMFIVDFR